MRTNKSFAPCVFMLLLTLLGHEPAMSQGFSITFAAAIDDVPVPIDSIWVKNVSSGGDTMLYTPDTILVLDFSTGMQNALPPAVVVSGLSMSQAVPNPYDGSTQFEVSVEDEGSLTLTVHDPVGRVLAHLQRIVGRGTHIFSCAGGPTGVLFVEAQWNGQRTTQRLLNMNGGQQMDLRYAGWKSMPGSMHLKSGWGTWQLGDSLFYIVFATGPYGYVFSASDGDTLTGPSTSLLDLLPGVVCAEEPLVADIDGNIYPVVQIGSQCWMAANLKTTHYRDGSSIPNVTDSTAWTQLSTGAWCNYQNDPANDATFGKLYNWYTTADPSMTCPLGWHVPTDADLTQLDSYLGDVSGGKMKTMGTIEAGTGPWYAPNTGASNASGFSGLPAGERTFNTGSFTGIGYVGSWWSASLGLGSSGLGFGLRHNNAVFGGLNYGKGMGCSIRCVRDQVPNDCVGVPNGTAYIDSCGACVGGNTGLAACTQDCTGAWGGSMLPGASCDDGNAGTVNDVYGSDCVCAGEELGCPGGATVTDIDGNVYPVVQIGGQCWMASNLKTAHYRDGSEIPHALGASVWDSQTVGAWCNYQDSSSYDTIYGKLYNWYAAADPNICPLGWHVPTDDEWQILEIALGMPFGELLGLNFRGAAQNVGGKLKATGILQSGTGYWYDPNTGATNESGFGGLPGGNRSGMAGIFGDLALYGHWWSASPSSSSSAWFRVLGAYEIGINRGNTYKRDGLCLRCLRD